jgi:hypothetical protein
MNAISGTTDAPSGIWNVIARTKKLPKVKRSFQLNLVVDGGVVSGEIIFGSGKDQSIQKVWRGSWIGNELKLTFSWVQNCYENIRIHYDATFSGILENGTFSGDYEMEIIGVNALHVSDHKWVVDKTEYFWEATRQVL